MDKSRRVCVFGSGDDDYGVDSEWVEGGRDDEVNVIMRTGIVMLYYSKIHLLR